MLFYNYTVNGSEIINMHILPKGAVFIVNNDTLQNIISHCKIQEGMRMIDPGAWGLQFPKHIYVNNLSSVQCWCYLITRVTAEAEWKWNVICFHVQGLGHDPTTGETEKLGFHTVREKLVHIWEKQAYIYFRKGLLIIKSSWHLSKISIMPWYFFN